MDSRRRWVGVAVATLCVGFFVARLARGQAVASLPDSPPKDRTRIVLSKALPKLDGEHLNATLVEVRYGPGEASSPHSHPCAVMAYVVQGAVRTRVKGQAETVYAVGDSFYEAP